MKKLELKSINTRNGDIFKNYQKISLQFQMKWGLLEFLIILAYQGREICLFNATLTI